LQVVFSVRRHIATNVAATYNIHPSTICSGGGVVYSMWHRCKPGPHLCRCMVLKAVGRIIPRRSTPSTIATRTRPVEQTAAHVDLAGQVHCIYRSLNMVRQRTQCLPAGAGGIENLHLTLARRYHARVREATNQVDLATLHHCGVVVSSIRTNRHVCAPCFRRHMILERQR